MSRASTLMLLAAVTAVAVAAAALSQRRGRPSRAPASRCCPVCPSGSTTRVSSAASAPASRSTSSLSDGRWVVREKDGYPADAPTGCTRCWSGPRKPAAHRAEDRQPRPVPADRSGGPVVSEREVDADRHQGRRRGALRRHGGRQPASCQDHPRGQRDLRPSGRRSPELARAGQAAESRRRARLGQRDHRRRSRGPHPRGRDRPPGR